ncbi:MAG: murein biosynthesis integral membrane protein MurJ [bacterium]
MVTRALKSIKTLLVKEQNEILSAAAILMILGFFGKVSGMLLQTLTARQFGAGKETDIFYLASVIPETITNIILIGAISGSIIPIFVKVKEQQGDKLFTRSFSTTFNISVGVFILLSILTGIFAGRLVPLAVSMTDSGTSKISAAEMQQVVLMMRVLLIPQIFLAISAFVSTSLNIYHRFIIPQLAPIFFNLGRTIGIMILVPLMHGSIWGLVWGTFLGSFLHLVIQLPLMKHLGISLKYGFIDWKDRHFKDVFKLGLPRIISLSAEQFAVVVDSVIAFGLTTGSLTAYQFAIRLISFPLTVFGTSFALASFPSLSKLYAKGAKVEFEKLISKLINQVLFLSLPVAVILLVLRIPIVRLVYGIFGGSFNWEDTKQVAWVLLFFTLGISFEGLRGTLFRIYYSIHDSRIPLISSIFVMIGGAVTGIMFTNYFSHFPNFSIREITFHFGYFFSKGTGAAGVGGLALSSSLIFTMEFIFLVGMLKYRGAVTELKPIVIKILKKLLVVLLMLIVSYAMSKMWEEVLDTAKTLQLILLTVTTSFAAFMLYLWVSFILGIEEVETFITFIGRNLKRFKKK